MIPKAKKSKKQKRPIEQVPRFEIIKLQNLLHISIMVRVYGLSTDGGKNESDISSKRT